MIVSDVAVRNRATVAMLVLLIVFMGGASYLTLPRESTPDVPMPYILVTTAYRGVAPEDVETQVTAKIEQEVAGVKGLKELRSVSAEGISTVIAEFQPDIAVEDALQYVRDRVDAAKGELPSEAEDPVTKEINIADFPILMLSISGNISPVRLKLIADEFKEVVEGFPGVLEVDVLGALEREIRLEVDPDRLAVYNLTLGELLRIIPSENVNVSAGSLETEGVRFNLRVPAEFGDPDEIRYLLLATRNGKPIYLADVAEISDTFEDRSSYSRLNGQPNITVSVVKRTGANIIEISDAVKAAVEKARKQAPAGVKITVTYDEADHVRMMISDLENNIISGLILVLIVLLAFMGWRSSAIVAMAVPLSMLISFAVVQALGYTLNMVVLFSLVLALGMMVDNAIVIVENIYRHMQLGKGRLQAALEGTREVAWPVTTSTATTVAAFFPVIFGPGIAGQFMKYLPITVIITLCSSLFVALIISPTVCAALAGKTGLRKENRDNWFVRSYIRLLRLSLANRATVLAMAVVIFAVTIALYAVHGRGVEFFPSGDPDRAIINMRFPQGTNIRETDRLTRIVEERVGPYGGKDLDHVIGTVGSGGGNMMFGGGSSGPHVSNVTLVFRKYEVRERPAAQAVAEIRELMTGLAGAEVKVETQAQGPPTGGAVNVRISGEDFKELERCSEEARRLIADVPGLVNLRSDLESARPGMIFRTDRRKAALAGVDTNSIGQFLKTAVLGREVGTFRQFNDEYDIVVRLPAEHRGDLREIFNLRVLNARGQSVPLSSLGEFEYRGGFGTINRTDQDRVVSLTGDAAEGFTGPNVLKDARKRLEEMELAPGYGLTYAGENEMMEEFQTFLGKAFVVALLLIAIILVSQFNSFKVPFIIMTTVALSLIGVIFSLLVFRMPFGIMMTGIGTISLAGVVVNNAIVLLDYTRQLRERGRSVLEATVEAGSTRLRPVLLTATTTILSLLPMATGVSFDFRAFELITRSQSSEWWRAMALAVIFGLAFATVLTLVVVPTLYVSLYGDETPENS